MQNIVDRGRTDKRPSHSWRLESIKSNANRMENSLHWKFVLQLCDSRQALPESCAAFLELGQHWNALLTNLLYLQRILMRWTLKSWGTHSTRHIWMILLNSHPSLAVPPLRSWVISSPLRWVALSLLHSRIHILKCSRRAFHYRLAMLAMELHHNLHGLQWNFITFLSWIQDLADAWYSKSCMASSMLQS